MYVEPYLLYPAPLTCHCSDKYKPHPFISECTEGGAYCGWIIASHKTNVVDTRPAGANFFFGRGFNLEIFLNLQGSEFIQTLLLIYNHLAKFVVYKSWTRSALLKGTSRCFLVSSITYRSKEAIEWVWSFFVVKLSTKPHPLLVLCFHRQ